MPCAGRGTHIILLLTTSQFGRMAVNFTPGQLRDAVGIGQETYRHWKKALAPLRRDAGHSPCFTAGDLLATAIIRTVVAGYGMRVSALSELAYGLFQACNAQSWPTLERSLMVLDVTRALVTIQAQGSGLVLDGPMLVVPLRTTIENLRRALLAGDGDGQEMLRFPPVGQPTGPVRRRAGEA